MAQVVDALRDVDRVAEIIANAYAEVALNPVYSYATMIDRFDGLVADLAAQRPPAALDDCVGDDFRKAFPLLLIDNPHALPQPSRPGRLADKLLRRLRLDGLVRRLIR
jgi:hypothetical protein